MESHDENVSSELEKFLNAISSVVINSYQLEFGGRQTGGNPELFVENHPLILQRAALFTEAKDQYDKLSHKCKKTIDFLVKSFYPKDHADYSNNFNEFIDNKVGGSGKNKGAGACLQDATHALQTLHNKIVENLDIGKLIPDNIVELCRKMPSPVIQRASSDNKQKQNNTNDNLKETYKKNPYSLFGGSTIESPLDTQAGYFEAMEKYYSNKSDPSYLLAKAIHLNDFDTIQSLIKQHSLSELETASTRSGSYHPCFHIAVEEGKVEAVKVLIENGFNLNIIDSNLGNRSPLSVAAEKGSNEIVELLIDCGAKTKLKDNFGRTPLEWRSSSPQVKT